MEPAEQAAREWFDERARLCEGVEADLRSLGELILTRERAAVAASWEPRCGETGRLSIQGVCPTHGGDSCLMASAIVEAKLAARREERATLESIRNLADARNTPYHADTVPVFQDIWTLATQALRRDPAGDARKPPPLTMGLSENLIARLPRKPAGDAGLSGVPGCKCGACSDERNGY